MFLASIWFQTDRRNDFFSCHKVWDGNTFAVKLFINSFQTKWFLIGDDNDLLNLNFFPIYFGLKPDLDAWTHFAAVKYKWKFLSNVKARKVNLSWTTWYRSDKIPWLKLPFVLEKMATAWQLFLWSQLVFSKSLWVDLPVLSTFAAKFRCHYRVNQKQTRTHTHTLVICDSHALRLLKICCLKMWLITKYYIMKFM